MLARDPEGDSTGSEVVVGGGVVVVVLAGASAAGADTGLLTLIGAVAVAVLTAVTTNRRQTKQLREEARRQATQLRHERERVELEHLRGFFDEVTVPFERMNAALDRLVVEWLDFDPDDSDASELRSAIREEVHDSYRDMSVAVRRMALRLPLSHPAVHAYMEITSRLSARTKAADDLGTRMQNREPVDVDAEDAIDNQLLEAVTDAWIEFVNLARGELDARATTTARPPGDA